MPRKNCLVIGAGLAGLSAAHRLQGNGWTVEVLEANKERLGGRVLTERVIRKGRKPLVYELGGEWVGDNHTRVKRLCKQFRLPLMRHRYSFAFLEENTLSRFYKPGTLPFSPSSNAAFNRFLKQFRSMAECEQRKLDYLDWWTKLKELGFSRSEALRRDLMDSTDFGESTRHSSAFAAAAEYGFSNIYDEMDAKIIGGNDRLIYALADSIKSRKGRIESGCEVSQILQTGTKITAITRSGRKFTADACICAVPATSLHHIRWHPALPFDQVSAARELEYARIIKTAFLFPEKFWPAFPHSGFSVFTSRASDFCFESTLGQEGPEGIICSYATGDKADDLADENGQDLAEWLSKDLSTALGKQQSQATFLKKQPWQREHRIGGAYAFYRPGQWFSVRPTLARPHRRVSFAGEHLSETWQGFMEGAVETGEEPAGPV